MLSRPRTPFFCSQIQDTLIDPNDPLGGFSDITSITPITMNLRTYESSGYDWSAKWQRQYDFGEVSLRALATHTAKQQLIQPSVTSPLLTNIAGVTGTPGGGSDWEPAADWNGQFITRLDVGSRRPAPPSSSPIEEAWACALLPVPVARFACAEPRAYSRVPSKGRFLLLLTTILRTAAALTVSNR